MSTYGLFGSGYTLSAQLDASEARGTARSAVRGVRGLDERVSRAMLACEAMWSLVRDKLGLSDEDLLVRINDLDLSDGQLDGKVRKTPVSCPSCKRTISSRLPKCMYCGQPIMHDPFA